MSANNAHTPQSVAALYERLLPIYARAAEQQAELGEMLSGLESAPVSSRTISSEKE